MIKIKFLSPVMMMTLLCLSGCNNHAEESSTNTDTTTDTPVVNSGGKSDSVPSAGKTDTLIFAGVNAVWNEGIQKTYSGLYDSVHLVFKSCDDTKWETAPVEQITYKMDDQCDKQSEHIILMQRYIPTDGKAGYKKLKGQEIQLNEFSQKVYIVDSAGKKAPKEIQLNNKEFQNVVKNKSYILNSKKFLLKKK